jgi:hypothetical protein
MKALYRVTFDNNEGDRNVDAYNIVASDAEEAIQTAKSEISEKVLKTYLLHSVEFMAEIDK